MTPDSVGGVAACTGLKILVSAVQSRPCPPFFSESSWELPKRDAAGAIRSRTSTCPKRAPFVLHLRPPASASPRKPHPGSPSLGVVVECLQLQARNAQVPRLKPARVTVTFTDGRRVAR